MCLDGLQLVQAPVQLLQCVQSQLLVLLVRERRPGTDAHSTHGRPPEDTAFSWTNQKLLIKADNELAASSYSTAVYLLILQLSVFSLQCWSRSLLILFSQKITTYHLNVQLQYSKDHNIILTWLLVWRYWREWWSCSVLNADWPIPKCKCTHTVLQYKNRIISSIF